MSVFDYLDHTRFEVGQKLFRRYEYNTSSNWRYEYSERASIYIRKSRRREQEPARIRIESSRNFPLSIQDFLNRGETDDRDYLVREDRIEALISLLRADQQGGVREIEYMGKRFLIETVEAPGTAIAVVSDGSNRVAIKVGLDKFEVRKPGGWGGVNSTMQDAIYHACRLLLDWDDAITNDGDWNDILGFVRNL